MEVLTALKFAVGHASVDKAIVSLARPTNNKVLHFNPIAYLLLLVLIQW